MFILPNRIPLQLWVDLICDHLFSGSHQVLYTINEGRASSRQRVHLKSQIFSSTNIGLAASFSANKNICREDASIPTLLAVLLQSIM